MKQVFLVVTILLFSILGHTQIITDGLIGYWPFNGNANDESINMNDGIVTGASLTTDRFGVPNAAYSFDGDGDYINLGNDSTLFPSSFSINLWFKYEEAQNSVLLGNINSLAGEWGTALSLREGAGPATAVASGENNHLIVHTSEKPLSDNEWHMLTLVYDAENNSQQISTYIDGCFSGFNNLVGSSGGFNSTDKVQFDQELDWYFGAASQFFFTNTNNGPQYFKGALDDGMLFNRPLSAREIIKLFTGEVYFSNVTVYDTVSIAVTDTLLIDFIVTSIINEPELANIKVYPNPTSSIININARIPNTDTEFNVSLIDNTGRVLYQNELSSSILSIDIGVFGGKGVYYLEIKDSNGNLQTTKKIILQ